MKPSFLLSFAPGGAIHTDYDENEPPHANTCIQLCNEVLLQPPKLRPASPALLDKHPQALPLLFPDDRRRADRNKGPLESIASFPLLQAGSFQAH